MTDLTLKFGTFSDTTIEVAAVTESARAMFAKMFGAGAVSAKLPKSRGEDFARFCEQRGLRVEVQS